MIFGGSLFVMKNKLGYELFPQSDVGQMEIQVRMESGTPLKTTEKTIAKMELLIRDELNDDLEQIISNIGIFYDLPAAYTPNSGTETVTLTPSKSNFPIFSNRCLVPKGI